MRLNWIVVGALSGALTVALGALGAHALEARVEPRQLEVWRTAVHYQGLHALALVALGLLGLTGGGAVRSSAFAGWAFTLGTLLFSGSLYAWVLGGPKGLVHLTPIGGVTFIVGWIALALAARGRARAGGGSNAPRKHA